MAGLLGTVGIGIGMNERIRLEMETGHSVLSMGIVILVSEGGGGVRA